MDWNEMDRMGEVFGDKSAPGTAMKEYYECFERTVLCRRDVMPGCDSEHEVALVVGSGLEAIGLDIEPSGISDGFEEAPDNAPQRVFPVREGRPSVHRMRRAHCFVGF